MDAFEQLVSEILWAGGYWVQTSVKVNLTKAEKRRINRPSSPRWELDVVGYQAQSNRLLVLECKSYINSRGVRWVDVCGNSSSSRYKLFREPTLRRVVLNRLCRQMVSAGSCAPGVTACLGLAAGKIYGADQSELEKSFAQNGWVFFGPDWLSGKLKELSAGQYENQVSAVVAKLLRN
ncbi:MAG: hypothetical protein ABR601_00025 [Parasphingopyxis sp.]|nr:hypothetical protein [Sphingomonadales bacterium]